jgi:hypothetical protein
MSWSDTTPAPSVASTPSWPAPLRRAKLNPRLEHQQANHAQRDRPGGRNRPSRKDRAPLLLRGSLPNILSYGER